jgi:hypothetical protein
MYFVFLLLLLWMCAASVAQGERTAYVASKVELVAAFRDQSVTTIVLTDSFSTPHNHSGAHDPCYVRR